MAKRRAKSTGTSLTRRPAAAAAATDLTIPLPDEGYGSEAFWSSEIDAAIDRLKEEVPAWRANMSRYDGDRPTLPGVHVNDTISVNVGFYTVEQKKPQLFHQQPALQVAGTRPETRPVAPIVKAIMDTLLGEDKIDAVAMMDEVLSDILVPAGIGVTKIGYESVTQDVKTPTGRMAPVTDPLTGAPVPKVDPMTGQPLIDPVTGGVQSEETLALGPDGQPETETNPQKLWCDYYWNRISPDDFLSPVGFLSSRFDAAPWLAFRFYADTEELVRRYGVEPSSFSDLNWSERLVAPADRDALEKRSVACGYEIWYRASLYDATELNPERIRRLVVLAKKSGRNGQGVVVHENSPWQRFDQMGRFTGGMRGYPIHVFTLRSRVNSAFPKSDCSVVRDIADEKSLGRSQMVQQRRRSMPMRGINVKSPALTRDTVEQLESGEIQSLIKFEGPISESDLRALAVAHFPNENFQFDAITQNDIDRLTASGANQQGLGSDDTDTAYEASLIQRATETRQAKERVRLLTQYARGCKKLFSLVQLFATDQELVEIVGEDGAKRFAQWDRTTIAGDYLFTFNPDSSVRVDASQEREKTLRFVNLVSNNPYFNQAEVAGLLCDAFGHDRAPLIKQPEPAKPEPPKATFSMRGDDLNPLSPQYEGVRMYLKTMYGVELPPPPTLAPELIKAPQGIEPVDKHDTRLTGNLQNNSGRTM